VKYPVVDVFKSVQGEGHFVGYPAVFVRLAGCRVIGCSIRAECDEAPWKATRTATAEQLAYEAFQLNPSGIVVITGGEPTDHDLIPLVDRLKAYCLRVHLETSGMRSIDGAPFDWITVSPKSCKYVQRVGHTLKLVVRPEWNFHDVVAYENGATFFHRYLQPLTLPDGSTNIAQVLAMVRAPENAGGRWALSTQAHKTWGLP
jgi:7-carboxy-7-deazaguanine synthase